MIVGSEFGLIFFKKFLHWFFFVFDVGVVFFVFLAVWFLKEAFVFLDICLCWVVVELVLAGCTHASYLIK